MVHTTKQSHDIAHVEEFIDREDFQRGPVYYTYGVRFLDREQRSLGCVELGWASKLKDAKRLVKEVKPQFDALITSTSVVSTTRRRKK